MRQRERGVREGEGIERFEERNREIRLNNAQIKKNINNKKSKANN